MVDVVDVVVVCGCAVIIAVLAGVWLWSLLREQARQDNEWYNKGGYDERTNKHKD